MYSITIIMYVCLFLSVCVQECGLTSGPAARRRSAGGRGVWRSELAGNGTSSSPSHTKPEGGGQTGRHIRYKWNSELSANHKWFKTNMNWFIVVFSLATEKTDIFSGFLCFSCLYTNKKSVTWINKTLNKWSWPSLSSSSELYTTEVSHLRTLRVLDQVFFQKMRSVLNTDELACIFPNLPQVYELHGQSVHV